MSQHRRSSSYSTVVFLPSNKSDWRGKAFPQRPTVTVKTISATVKIPRLRDAFSGWLVLLLLVLGSFRPPTGPARRYPSLSPGANSPRPSDPTRSSCCVATRPVGPSATVLSLSRWCSAARSRPLLPAETVAMLTTSRWAPGCDGGCASLCPGNSTSLPGQAGLSVRCSLSWRERGREEGRGWRERAKG